MHMQHVTISRKSSPATLLKGKSPNRRRYDIYIDHSDLIAGAGMADLPPFSFFSSPSRAGASTLSKEMEMALATELIQQLNDPDRRENALHKLSKKRELFQELAPLLWSSFGTITVLIQEILSVYPALSPPTLTSGASNRVCNALALLQCVASHPDTRSLFLNAQIPLYLFPFLSTTAKTKPFEYLRLTSLGVIGSLVKVDDAEVVNYLLSTEIVPLCLRTMETGSELSKTVATFIILKILLDKVGLRYFCSTVEKFYSVGRILVDMVVSLDEQPSTRLLKHVIRCFLRLSDNPRGCFGLKMLLFELFRSGAFNSCLDDPTIRQWLQQLLQNITVGTAETLLRPRIFNPLLRT